MMLCMTADKLPMSTGKLPQPARVNSRGRAKHAASETALQPPGTAITRPPGSRLLHEPHAAAGDAARAFAALSRTTLQYKPD